MMQRFEVVITLVTWKSSSHNCCQQKNVRQIGCMFLVAFDNSHYMMKALHRVSQSSNRGGGHAQSTYLDVQQKPLRYERCRYGDGYIGKTSYQRKKIVFGP
jgi:hypothetical protein